MIYASSGLVTLYYFSDFFSSFIKPTLSDNNISWKHNFLCFTWRHRAEQTREGQEINPWRLKMFCCIQVLSEISRLSKERAPTKW